MARDCKGNSIFANSKFPAGNFRPAFSGVRRFAVAGFGPRSVFGFRAAGVSPPAALKLLPCLKEPRATLAHLRLNKDLNLGPHD